MTVVSTKEFNANQEKYFDMAASEDVVIQRGGNLFIIQSYIPYDEPDVIFEPDEDFYRSFTAEELLDGIYEDIDIFFANK